MLHIVITVLFMGSGALCCQLSSDWRHLSEGCRAELAQIIVYAKVLAVHQETHSSFFSSIYNYLPWQYESGDSTFFYSAEIEMLCDQGWGSMLEVPAGSRMNITGLGYFDCHSYTVVEGHSYFFFLRMDENYNLLPHGVNFQDAIFADTQDNWRLFSSLFQYSNCSQGQTIYEQEIQEDSREQFAKDIGFDSVKVEKILMKVKNHFIRKKKHENFTVAESPARKTMKVNGTFTYHIKSSETFPTVLRSKNEPLTFIVFLSGDSATVEFSGSGKFCVTKEYIEGELPENCGNINKPGMPKKLELMCSSIQSALFEEEDRVKKLQQKVSSLEKRNKELRDRVKKIKKSLRQAKKNARNMEVVNRKLNEKLSSIAGQMTHLNSFKPKNSHSTYLKV